jgi:hypothetical protein
MRRLLLSMLLASAASVSLAADNASLSGKWKVHSTVAGNESDLECTFTQKDNDLSGTCTTDSGDKNITGKVDGAKISWSYDADYNGTPLTVKYSGTLDSDGKLAGGVHVDPFDVDGDFTATAPKKDK